MDTIVFSMKCVFVEIILNFPVHLLLSCMLHFGRKRTNASIHTIYIYLFEHRKGGYYTQYIFFNYIIINQVHFQMHALLKCSIFLVVSTYVMTYWRLDTLGITISYVTLIHTLGIFPLWFFFVLELPSLHYKSYHH